MATHLNTAKRKSANRGPKNLSLPAELRERLAAASEATGIPESRIAEQGLRWRLAQLDAAQPTIAPTRAQ
jgi:Ribbon-helix-helix domain